MTRQWAGAPDERRHERRGRRGVEFVRGAELLQAARAEQRDPVAEVEGFLLLVGHQHRGDAEAMDERAQLAPGPLAERGVEIGERLVEQEHLRLRRERPRQRHALLLAAREFAMRAPLEPVQVHQRQRLAAPGGRAPRRRAVGFQPEGHVWPDVEMGKEGVVLEHHAEAPARRGQAP